MFSHIYRNRFKYGMLVGAAVAYAYLASAGESITLTIPKR